MTNLTALLDQADAAHRHAHTLFASIAEQRGTTPSETRAADRPATNAILTRMRETMINNTANGHPTLCPHLSYQAPSIAVWIAHAPGKLRCPPCAETTMARVRGTPEDRRCDHCHHIKALIHPCAAQLPPVVLDRPGHTQAIPPITAAYGLCQKCMAIDQAAVTG